MSDSCIEPTSKFDLKRNEYFVLTQRFHSVNVRGWKCENIRHKYCSIGLFRSKFENSIEIYLKLRFEIFYFLS